MIERRRIWIGRRWRLARKARKNLKKAKGNNRGKEKSDLMSEPKAS